MANEYKIETAHDSSSLAKKVNELIKEGWQTVGSHQATFGCLTYPCFNKVLTFLFVISENNIHIFME